MANCLRDLIKFDDLPKVYSVNENSNFREFAHEFFFYRTPKQDIKTDIRHNSIFYGLEEKTKEIWPL